jgi:predicted nucleotidyltransferase
MEQISYNIIKELQKKENHIREIAKLLNTNHMTVQRKIKQLEKEHIVDFEENGRNKTYFLKKNLEAKTMMKIVENKKQIEIIKKHPRIRTIIEQIQKEKIDLAIIFGSYAKNNENENSDIDIYIKTKNKNIKDKIEKIDTKINVKIGEFDKNNLLIKEIIKNHVIIKGIEKYYELIY